MFTGCIENTGKFLSRSRVADGEKLLVAVPWADNVKLGQSIAVNGVCLTADRIKHDENAIQFHTLAETLKKTNLGSLDSGAEVNLERALRIGDRLDGHFVSGHIDCTGAILDIIDFHNDRVIEIELLSEFTALIVKKGSIAIDGISLTVVAVKDSSFTVHIIPDTLKNTNLRQSAIGMSVNLEMDMIGKYIQRFNVLDKH